MVFLIGVLHCFVCIVPWRLCMLVMKNMPATAMRNVFSCANIGAALRDGGAGPANQVEN